MKLLRLKNRLLRTGWVIRRLPGELLRSKRSIPGSYERILVVATLRLGDLVMATPVFRALKKAHPDAKITVVARSGVADLLSRCPSVDNSIVYHGGKRNLCFRTARKQLASEKFDLCVNLCEGKYNSLVFSAGIPLRVGFIQKRSWREQLFLTHALEPKQPFRGIPQMFLDLLTPLGIACADTDLHLEPEGEDLEAVRCWLPSASGPRILVHPGASSELKRWPFFAKLIAELIERFSAQVILTGSSDERRIGEQIVGELTSGNVINAIGRTTLRELLALASVSDAMVGNDTGSLHIARAAKTPTVTLFGPENPIILGDAPTNCSLFRSLPCRPNHQLFGMQFPNLSRCRATTCSHHSCMREITVEDVTASLEGVANLRLASST